MKTQYTPGPWKVDGSGMGIYTETPVNCAGFCPVVAGTARPDVTLTEARANAHLVAAAPELLEFLRKIESAAGSIDGDKAVYLEQARYVIAKALGKQDENP